MIFNDIIPKPFSNPDPKGAFGFHDCSICIAAMPANSLPF